MSKPLYLGSSKSQDFQSILGLKRLSTDEFNAPGTLPFPRITDFLTWKSKLFSHAKAKSLKFYGRQANALFTFRVSPGAKSSQRGSPFKGRSQEIHDFQTASLGRKGRQNAAANAVRSALVTVLGKGRRNTANPPQTEKLFHSPRVAALVTNFPAAARVPSLTGGRSHDSPSSLLPRSPPSIHASLTVHCFKSFGRKEKPPQRPHFVPRPRRATEARHKGCSRV